MKTEIICIVDRSGSMSSMRNDAIGGYNTFIKDQQNVPGEARVTFTQFDDRYDIVYNAKPLADVPQLDDNTFVPRGSTALLDAIGRTLNEQGKRIADEKWADKVIVVIITDGGENASREYTREQVNEMTKHAQEKAEWSFIYLGANQDAIQVATNLGINTRSMNNLVNNFAATGEGMRATYASTSASVANLRGGGTAR